MFSKLDLKYMALAIKLANKGIFTTMPNPRVGCVIVKNNKIIGKGWHVLAGQAHAEVNAIKKAIESVKGSTVYVTLEPCSFYGKTPACCNALIKAEVNNVIIGMLDPNPKVSGRGVELLKKAGVGVQIGCMKEDAFILNPGFIKRMQTGLPYVRCKLAMSLDGRTAMSSGESKWITSTDAREDAHKFRAQSCAIITGVNTINIDNPSLTARAFNKKSPKYRQPLRVIADSKLRVSPCSKIFIQEGKTLIACGLNKTEKKQKLLNEILQSLKKQQCEEKIDDVEILEIPNSYQKIDFNELLLELGSRECNEVLIESGAIIAGSCTKKELIDEFVIYTAPVFLGSCARPLLSLPIDNMNNKIGLTFTDVVQLGSDLRLLAKPISKR